MVLAGLAAPAPTYAATLDVHDGTLRYVGAAGGQSRINLEQVGPSSVRLTRQPGDGDTDAIAVGPDCFADVNPDSYVCTSVSQAYVDLGDERDGVGAYMLTSIRAHLEGGPGDDYLSGGRAGDVLRGGSGADYLYAADGGNEVDGGDGDDEIFSDTGTDVLRGGGGFDTVEFSRTEDPAPRFSITLDSVANDGVAGENDLVAADVEDVSAGSADFSGAPGASAVHGNAETNVLKIDYGHATVTGGAGNDVLIGGPHDDVLDARDGFADRVTCGEGSDSALLDAVDTIGSSCETVQRLAPPAATAAAADDAPPRISLVQPEASAILTVGSRHTFAADAADDRGLAKVQFLLGDQLVCEDASAPFTCGYTPTQADAGKQTVVAIAVDSRQQTAVALRSVTVQGKPDRVAPVAVPPASLEVAQGAQSVGVPVECRTQNGATCMGTLTITARVPGSSPKTSAKAARRGRRITIARARFSAASGERTVVRAKISRRAVRRVLPPARSKAGRRTIKVRVAVAIQNADGTRAVSARTTKMTFRSRGRR